MLKISEHRSILLISHPILLVSVNQNAQVQQVFAFWTFSHNNIFADFENSILKFDVRSVGFSQQRMWIGNLDCIFLTWLKSVRWWYVTCYCELDLGTIVRSQKVHDLIINILVQFLIFPFTNHKLFTSFVALRCSTWRKSLLKIKVFSFNLSSISLWG